MDVNPTMRTRLGKVWRIGWTALSLVVVEGTVVGLAIVPAAWLMQWPWGLVLRSMMLAPAYVAFALALMALSATAMRLCGWRTPPDVQTRITDLEWPLLDWVRYMVSSHLVRVFAGTLFRATPVWSLYHRLNGARLGRGVYINSLAVVDDNLLEFGDHVVIGHGVHLSGHTVEQGFLKTGAVRLGADVTIGVESVIGIGVEIGAGTQIGALSLVPKHQRLEGGAFFGGAPVHRLAMADLSGRSAARGTSRRPTPAARIPPRGGTSPSPTRVPGRA